jgi:hypothetical protein
MVVAAAALDDGRASAALDRLRACSLAAVEGDGAG